MKRLMGAALVVAAVMAASCSKTGDVAISSAADLAGRKVGCQAGTTGETWIQENVADVKLKSFKTGIDAALSLKNGAIDAIVLDELPAREIVRRNPELAIVDDEFAVEEYAIAVRKGNEELLASINETIAAIKSDGTYEALVGAFMPVDGKIVLPEVEILDSRDIVKMGTNASFPPFEYIYGSEVVGFDVSMSALIAKNAGRKLQVVDMAFDGLVAALQAGAVDFVAAGMSDTEERRQNVDFSEPYYQSKQVIIIRAPVEESGE
ncbi:MAG: transporter substrate-binding domain-containing protein [Treponemataceae bacterium]|nr:transporter substrate-binding domain-containing protein [Treponemataceae bacterium]